MSHKDRRELFQSIVQAVREVPERRAPVPPPAWPLPPGAVAPEDFLALCTQCGDCITACPHNAIGPLPQSDSPWAGRPALNPGRAPCHLCEDLPCVSACEPKALMPVTREGIFFGLAVVDPNKCIVFKGPECGACKPVCPIHAISLSLGRPVVDEEVCNGCGLCRLACPVWDKAIDIELV